MAFNTMHDPTFHSQTLLKEVNLGDLLRNRALFNASNKAALIDAALSRVDSGYEGVRILSRKVNGSNVYHLDKLADELVLRKVAGNIRRVTGVRQTNRSSIIKCLCRLASEGVGFQIYKIDIKGFYENINPDLFLVPITTDSAFPPSTIKMLESFFAETRKNGITGLPRGLGLSAVLSEYVMREFDAQVMRTDGVFFYSRFVDDMIVITRGDQDHRQFLAYVNESLPSGLVRNERKTKCFVFSNFNKLALQQVEHKFDFLGYDFRVSTARRVNNRIIREVKIDISVKKVARIKTRICISFLQYVKDGSFSDLIDRIRMLSANYTFFDIKKNAIRKAGIYHSYQLLDPDDSCGLRELDAFYKKMILSNQGKISGPFFAATTKRQRRELLRYSFERGFKNRYYFAFDANRVAAMRRCWANV